MLASAWAMSEPSANPRAAGFFLMLAIFVGAIGGVIAGQPSAGLLIGIAAGSAIAVALWLSDRRRIGR